jgi:hypothetical protein
MIHRKPRVLSVVNATHNIYAGIDKLCLCVDSPGAVPPSLGTSPAYEADE